MRPMPNNHWILRYSSILLAGALLSACGGDDGTPTEVTLDDLAGTWTATSLSARFGGGFSIDLLGANTVVTLEITNAGRFTLTAQDLQIGPDVTVMGTFEITGPRTAKITADGSQGDPLATTFNLSGNTLSVTISDAALIDLDSNGTIDQADAVTLIGTLVR